MTSSGTFKKCKVCDTQWSSRDQFINDPEISLVGYQANFVILEKGLFLFNHSCQSTLSIEVQAFADLYVGSVFEERVQGSDECPGYCLHHSQLQPCPAKCECTYVREILSMLQKPDVLTCQAV